MAAGLLYSYTVCDVRRTHREWFINGCVSWCVVSCLLIHQSIIFTDNNNNCLIIMYVHVYRKVLLQYHRIG